MAMAYLNAGARPYHRRPSYRPHPSPLQPPPPPPAVPAYYYGNAGCPPPLHLAPSYSRVTFPEHHYPLRLPPPQQQFFRNHAPSPPRHGPHGLAFPNNRGGFVCEKLYAQAMYRYNNKAGAAGAWDGRRGVACGPRAWSRGRGSAHAHAPVARAAGRAARSPSPAFMTRPGTWIPPPPWFGRTTVMIRNIPTKLTRAAVMDLLDDHCARENRRRRGRAAAYDFLYLPMDFSEPSSNRGYAFVNFTTADAARGFHYALHGCGWKPWVAGRGYKTVNIAAAHIQGKRAVLRRFSRSKFVCDTDEFLPAVFRPPRNGANNAQPRNLGRRLTPLVSPVQQPPPVEPPQQQQQQQLAWMTVRVQAS